MRRGAAMCVCGVRGGAGALTMAAVCGAGCSADDVAGSSSICASTAGCAEGRGVRGAQLQTHRGGSKGHMRVLARVCHTP